MIANIDNVAMMRPATTTRSPATTFSNMFAPLREMMEIMEYPARQGDLRQFLRLALPCILSRTFLNDREAVAAVSCGVVEGRALSPDVLASVLGIGQPPLHTSQ